MFLLCVLLNINDSNHACASVDCNKNVDTTHENIIISINIR